MNLIDDQEFEPVVREAMIARPQPASISNLAYRAIELARSQSILVARGQIEFIARMRRRSQWVGIAALVLIVVVVLAGMQRLSNAGLIGGTATVSTTVNSNSADLSSAAGSVGTLGVQLTAVFLAVAMILLSAGIASSRPDYAQSALC
jgi:hypothetical protein